VILVILVVIFAWVSFFGGKNLSQVCELVFKVVFYGQAEHFFVDKS
jgi:hypothetical protein